MITRKRGRIGENGRNGARSPATAAFREPAETTDSQQSSVCQQFSSESEDASGLDLEDFLGLDGLNWTLDDDALSPLLDITGTTTTNADGDDSAEIGASPLRVEELSAPLKIRGPAQKTQKLEESFPGRINKNAIAARMNRLKKKEYVNGLEKKVGTLVTENCSLRQENSKLNKRVEELEDETRYLRAVLANESMLAQLLSRLSGVNGMKLSTSLFQESNKNDHDYALPRKRVKVDEKETAGGICLHVDTNHVSVEFCSKCAESASSSLKM